ncbi:MAG: polysaccharide pyruvyl transferase family protein [Bacteroidales bacterium]|nr:polysaccharide pyruvyl transferase family protein [Bacteroidales bacterium]
MKICILTQPLYTNYGGLLQAYALQTVLKNLGHEVVTEDRRYDSHLTLIERLKRINWIRTLTGKRKIYYPDNQEMKVISQYTDQFIKKHISVTGPVLSHDDNEIRNLAFDAYIVGSDQVWRPMYSPNLKNYFLDFTAGKNVKRIAYAASFGTDRWEFTPEQTKVCSELVKKFDAISVREDSGVNLCREHLGVKAVTMLDPTLLLDKEEYINLVFSEDEAEHDGNVMTYFLDRTELKDAITKEICRKLSGRPFCVTPEKKYSDVGPKGLYKCVYPSVTYWLKGFMDAEYIVTDSFHGTVFSIIFNKPFIAVANKERGLSRFVSLLEMFGLEDRLVFSIEDVSEDLIFHDIDFARVNSIRKAEQAKAFSFLKKSLQ